MGCGYDWMNLLMIRRRPRLWYLARLLLDIFDIAYLLDYLYTKVRFVIWLTQEVEPLRKGGNEVVDAGLATAITLYTIFAPASSLAASQRIIMASSSSLRCRLRSDFGKMLLDLMLADSASNFFALVLQILPVTIVVQKYKISLHTSHHQLWH